MAHSARPGWGRSRLLLLTIVLGSMGGGAALWYGKPARLTGPMARAVSAGSRGDYRGPICRLARV